MSLFIPTSLSLPLKGSITRVFFCVSKASSSSESAMASLLNMVSVPPRISPTSHTRIASLQARPVLPAFSVSFSSRWLTPPLSGCYFSQLLCVLNTVLALLLFPHLQCANQSCSNSFLATKMVKVAVFMLFWCGLFQWIWNSCCFYGHSREETIN